MIVRDRLPGIERQLEQGTQGWLDWRAGGIGGSDAAVIKMGDEFPFSTSIVELWKVKTGRSAGPEQNERMERGHKLEPIARELYERQTGIWVEPVCMEHPYMPYMRASLDGITEDRRIILEIKCPNVDTHNKALAGELTPYYYCQMQHQLAVSGADECHYWSYNPDEADETRQTALMIVYPDYAYIEDLMMKIKAFWQCVEQDIPPDGSYEVTTASRSLGLLGLVHLSAYATAGKDTFGRILEGVFSSRRFGYADKVKGQGVRLGGYSGDEKKKEKERKFLVDLGDGMREVFPEIWARGIFNQKTGIYEAMRTSGAHITDCRNVNEHVLASRAARSLGVPYRLIWIERPGIGPKNDSERIRTRLLKPLADTIIHNDVDLRQVGTTPLEQALITAIATDRRDVRCSDYVKERAA